MKLKDKVPESWAHVTVEQFIEFSTLQNEKFSTGTELSVQKCSILLNKPAEEIENLDYDKFISLLGKISFTNQPPNAKPKEKINVSGEDFYYFNDFNQLTVGAFIDLEYLFTNNYHQNLPVILAVLYRRKTILNSPFESDYFEPYGNWIYHRQQLFMDLPITDVYGIIKQYLNWRENIFRIYEGLFNVGNDELTDEELKELSAQDRAEYLKGEENENTFKKWSWEFFLYKLAQTDFTSIEQAADKNIIIALKQFAMKLELQIKD